MSCLFPFSGMNRDASYGNAVPQLGILDSLSGLLAGRTIDIPISFSGRLAEDFATLLSENLKSQSLPLPPPVRRRSSSHERECSSKLYAA